MTEGERQPESQWLPGGWPHNIEEIVASLALVGVVVSTAWGVFTRYVTASPATWTAEIAGVAFCWMVFVGAAAAFKRGMHISIDMLVMALPRLLARPITVSVDLIVLGFLVWVSWLTIEFTIESWNTPMPSLRWPYSIHYAGAALGLVLMALRHGLAARTRWSATS